MQCRLWPLASKTRKDGPDRDMDIVWVVGSYVLLFAVRFSVGGKWAVAVGAELVFLFAVIQWRGLQGSAEPGKWHSVWG